jgi:uncharacterized membrane protein YdbT with pleckstrin-like domain
MSQPEYLTMNVGDHVTYDVSDYDALNTLDTTEALTLNTSAPSVATVALVPGNNRQVLVTAVGAGSATVTISAGGVPNGASAIILVVVAASQNLSHVEVARAQ